MTDSVKIVQSNVTESKKIVKTDATDSVNFMQVRVMDSVFIRGQGRANIRRKRATRKALTAIESDDDEEVSATETVQ